MDIVKRNGEKQTFNFNKIESAIRKAYASLNKHTTDEEQMIKLVLDVVDNSMNILFKQNRFVTVEQIQDAVENALMSCGQYEVAKKYILYREKHNDLRFIKERVDYMDNQFTVDNHSVASLSETDPNANVGLKNVATQEAEVYKTTNRTIHRYRMYKKLQEMFPNIADQYEKDLNDHIIYVHDEATTPVLKNYCEAVSLYPLVTEGCGNMDGTTPGPPKNFHSFCGQLVNLTHSLAGQCKGAVAFGEFFNFLDYFCLKDFGNDYHKYSDYMASVKPNRTVLEAIHQGYQQIVCG